MRYLAHITFIATVLCVPVISIAQSITPVSRDQVRAELVELERAGYHLGDDDPHYPDAIQAAEARVAAQHAISDGYGGIRSQSSVSGAPVNDQAQADPKRLYRGR
ncbi:DUF4148 domain-containing protein [Paraburkholderia hospita]|uniref:DUF4148 domain-containing protein n=1 Tax=Paraburkholderia hospita TaxID=169430 RepID=UPI000B3430D4|nr:DUF4148 domain-containing protein [Paraburkholderia hospita]OUL77936.1 hypothetical protein CA603_35150 [Paraburkholderia hospita]